MVLSVAIKTPLAANPLPSITISGPSGFRSPPKVVCVRPSKTIPALGLFSAGSSDSG
jgi:hypothetical protein